MLNNHQILFYIPEYDNKWKITLLLNSSSCSVSGTSIEAKHNICARNSTH